VLGHEIAHNVARHAAERTSQMYVFVALSYVLALVFGVPDVWSQILLDYGFLRPGSRKQEVCYFLSFHFLRFVN
jgi:Zn-dependent protease with chaperone function